MLCRTSQYNSHLRTHFSELKLTKYKKNIQKKKYSAYKSALNTDM